MARSTAHTRTHFNAVSIDLKSRIPVLRALGYSVRDICSLLGIKKTLAYNVLHYQSTYNVPYNPHTMEGTCLGRQRVLGNEDISFIRSLIHCNGMLYLDEIQALLLERRNTSVSIPTLSRTLRRIQYTKKRVSARAIERNEVDRAVYMNTIAEIAPDPEMLMFTDESAKDERTSARRTGWSAIGNRCVSRRVFVRGKRFSILPLLTLDGIITYDVIEGSVTADSFIKFIRDMVVRSCLPFTLACIHIAPNRYHSQILTPALVVSWSWITAVSITQKSSVSL